MRLSLRRTKKLPTRAQAIPHRIDAKIIQPSTCQAHHILAAYILKAHRFARIYATLCSAKLDAE